MAKSRLFRSTIIVSSMTMLSRILGLIRDMVLLSVFGAGGLMDAFVMAFKIPNFLRRLFAEGAFSQAFVPVLSEYKEKYSLAEVQILISRTAGALSLILSVLTVTVILLAPQVMGIFGGGFADEPEKFNTAVELLRLTFPYLLFISMTAFAGSILQSYGRFAAPAFAPVLLNLCMISAALLIAPMMDTPIMALGYAVAIAGFLQFCVQLPQLYQQKLLVKPTLAKHEGVSKILTLMLPAIFGVSVTQINLLINARFASEMIDGSVTWMYAAERLSELPLGLIGIAIGTVILPSLSKSEIQQDDETFVKTLDWAARLIVLVGMPAMFAMFVLADVFMQALYMSGEFTPRDADMAGFALRCLSGGILGFMLIKIFAPAFFARQDTKTPVQIGIVSVIANIVFSLCFVSLFHYVLALPLHGGLALATTCASLVNAGLLYYFLHKRNIFRFGKHWKKLFVQFSAASACMVVSLYALLPYFPAEQAQWMRMLAVLAICAVGAAVYGIVLLATGFRPRQLKHG